MSNNVDLIIRKSLKNTDILIQILMYFFVRQEAKKKVSLFLSYF